MLRANIFRHVCSDAASLGDASLDERFSLSLSSTLSFTQQRNSAADDAFLDTDDDADEEVAPESPAASQAESNAAPAETSELAEQALEDALDSNGSASSASPAYDAQLRNTGHDRTAAQSAGAAWASGAAAQDARAEAQSAASMAAFRAARAPDQAPLTGAPSHLRAAVRVDMRVELSPPLTAVPGFLLSYAGRLVAAALLQALIPILLDLLARDYERWEARHTHLQINVSGTSHARELSIKMPSCLAPKPQHRLWKWGSCPETGHFWAVMQVGGRRGQGGQVRAHRRTAQGPCHAELGAVAYPSWCRFVIM